jgi:hypothetical protein
MHEVTLQAVPHPFGASDLVQLAISLVILCVATAHARHVRPDAGGSFALRLLVPTLAIAASVTLLSLVEGLGSGAERVVMMLLMLLSVGLLSLVLILVMEAIASPMRPCRTIKWVAASLFLFLACFLIIPFISIAELAPSVAGPLVNWRLLELVGVVAAGALVWWSYLPASAPSPNNLRD